MQQRLGNGAGDGVKRLESEKKVNKLCSRCLRHCRQPESAVLVDCPRFLPRPFKVAVHRFDQLDLFGEEPGKR